MKQIKIAALGDSLTKGVVLNDENRYSILKQGFINIIGEKLDLCIKNYAKFGCTIGFGHNVIDRHHDDISSSDYTFLEFGGNDCDFDWRNIAEDPEMEHEPKTLLETFKEQFVKLIERVRGLGSHPVIISLPPIDSENYFSFFSRFMDEKQKRNVVEWLGGDIGTIYRWHEMYNRMLFEISEQTQTDIIDITSPFENYSGGVRSLLCTDGIHPNEKGHLLIAHSISGVAECYDKSGTVKVF